MVATLAMAAVAAVAAVTVVAAIEGVDGAVTRAMAAAYWAVVAGVVVGVAEAVMEEGSPATVTRGAA